MVLFQLGHSSLSTAISTSDSPVYVVSVWEITMPRHETVRISGGESYYRMGNYRNAEADFGFCRQCPADGQELCIGVV